MSSHLSRRGLLAGLVAVTGNAALGAAPERSLLPRPRPGLEPPSAEDIVAKSRLDGRVGYALIDVESGTIVEAREAALPLPPASTTKAPTALFGLAMLGPGYRFRTELVATGPVAGGRVEGDLILRGGGDPTLDTDALGALAAELKARGVHAVRGRFLIDAGALPGLPHIDPDQPEHVGYNPAISGLNLNFNRVHFEWKRGAAGYETTMQARALRYRPGVQGARMEIVDRAAPVFTYEMDERAERWTVAKAALGRDGARWLPVRRPADYAGEVFQVLARSHGIELRPGGAAPRGAAGEVLAAWESPPLTEVLADMLDYSTNLTAEAVGLTAAARLGPLPDSLAASSARMNGWLGARFGADAPGFVDHSGLGYGSRVNALDLAGALARGPQLAPLLDDFRVRDDGYAVPAKTGTLNFTSALAGYVTPPGGRQLAFAILAADVARRDAIPPEQRERPPGARTWANRARRLQKDLVAGWAASYRV